MNTLLLGIYAAPIGVIDFLYGFLFVVIVLVFASSKKSRMLKTSGNEHYKYYVYNIYFKFFFALVYAAIYKYYYQGGDTMAYWFGAESLNNLFWYSPADYWKELLMTPGKGLQMIHFNSETGYPPGWIYRDPNSFFVSKIFSIFMLIFGKSYLLLTLILSKIMAKASWKVYELVISYKITSAWMAALAVLFIPSVSFWCAGFSKDTVVLIAVFYILYYAFAIANGLFKKRFFPILFSLFALWILFETRSFMSFTIIGALFASFSTRFVSKYGNSGVLKFAIRFLILSIGTIALLLFLKYEGDTIAKTTNTYITEAAVSHDDFTNNSSYGNKRYELTVSDYSPIGMLKSAPKAVLIAIYRPGIWEARSPLLLISALETLLFLTLTLSFIFKGSLKNKIRIIQENEFLIFSLLFVIILAFFAGFTSILFGVLVRFKAPLLPFLLIILVVKKKKVETDSLK